MLNRSNLTGRLGKLTRRGGRRVKDPFDDLDEASLSLTGDIFGSITAPVTGSIMAPIAITVGAPEGADPEPGAIRSTVALGRMVRQARKGMKLSQQQLADAAGVGRRFVSELENGKPTLEIGRALKVCEAAGVLLIGKMQRR